MMGGDGIADLYTCFLLILSQRIVFCFRQIRIHKTHLGIAVQPNVIMPIRMTGLHIPHGANGGIIVKGGLVDGAVLAAVPAQKSQRLPLGQDVFVISVPKEWISTRIKENIPILTKCWLMRK